MVVVVVVGGRRRRCGRGRRRGHQTAECSLTHTWAVLRGGDRAKRDPIILWTVEEIDANECLAIM